MDKTLTDAVLVANEAGLTDRELAAVVEAATVARRRAEASRPGLVPMVHPKLLDRPPELVDPEAVEVLERSGWTVQVAAGAFKAALDDADLPKGNASRDEWAAYALSRGLTADDIEPLTRDEIRDHFNEEN